MVMVMHDSAATRSEPKRRCVVCRAERSDSKLVRLGLMGGAVHPVTKSGGRGAHVCATRTCLEQITARHVARSLRGPVEQFAAASLIRDLHQLAERRFLETVGLARRQGILAVGVQQMSDEGELVVVASDLAPRSFSQLGSGARRFLGGAALGRAAGMGWVGVMRIAPGRLAEQAAYWLSLWYETRSPAERPAGGQPQGTEVV